MSNQVDNNLEVGHSLPQVCGKDERHRDSLPRRLVGLGHRLTVPRPFERAILRLDSFPWDAAYRTLIGFAVFPTASFLGGRQPSGWMVIVVLVGVLLILRMIPALVRKLVPFSDAAQVLWSERRQLAKRYDCYQWRKLFWIGVGLAMYVAVWREARTLGIFCASFCLLSGAVGFARWRAVAPSSKIATSETTRDGRNNLVSK